MLETQGLLGIAFFAATAHIILLVLFLLLRRDHDSAYYRWWLAGWIGFTASSICESLLLIGDLPALRVLVVLTHAAALLAFLVSVLKCTVRPNQWMAPIVPLIAVTLLGVYYFEKANTVRFGALQWESAALESTVCLLAGWMVWRMRASHLGYGPQLLAGAFLLSGLHGLDRVFWPQHPLFVLRVAFDHLLGVAMGIAMVVFVLEGARSRAEELNDKMKRLALLTAASTQTLSVEDFLHRVLAHLVESLGITHGLVRLMEGEGNAARLVTRAAVGFSQEYLDRYKTFSVTEPWAQQLLKEECKFLKFDQTEDLSIRQRMAECGLKELVTLALRGKKGPLGIIAIGATRTVRFHPEELAYMGNMANLLGLTLQNLHLFEQVATVQQQWAYTFDSIGDPIFVHDQHGRILRANQRCGQLMGKESAVLAGRTISELLPPRNLSYKVCPYCENIAGEGDELDPWLSGYFLASNSNLADPAGSELGIVHALKDVSERKRAEEKYRNLVSNVQEGVFISTPNGRFLDFNDALLRMTGYTNREQLLGGEIAASLYVNPTDRERLKKLLAEHGSVADFEFEMRRKDGEVRTMMESSIAVRDAAGNVTAYQGFVLDITERKQAEHEIRRRNRELMVLNSIAETLTESMDLTDSLHRTLRQLAELFRLDASLLYLVEKDGKTFRRMTSVGLRSEQTRPSSVPLQAEFLQHIKAVHATFLSVKGLPLPLALRDALKKEAIVSAYIVILWSKDRVIGGLVVGSRTLREFSAADINLLIAVGSQIASAIERSLLYDETRHAYENLRRTQEQLLHSEKMAAVGQLISGVAHELNNPLTAILGYSQLLISSGEMGSQGLEYTEKLYKQAQRTHRIVQNLLSFARQHKPERVPVQLNQVVEDTLALRDYDLRTSNVRMHLNLAADLPMTAADPHQLQQVFLNIINNAVDAILECSSEGDVWVRTGTAGDRLIVEFVDNGPGVKDPARVFDPFYTTKPVGKGTGLGLSICYGIITEHGGTIRVRNVSGRGASFTIELPFQPVASEAVEETQAGSKQETAARILLLDQDESVLEAVETLLRKHEHQVRAAKNVEEAVALLEETEFDLIVADSRTGSAVNTNGSSGDGKEKGLENWLTAHRPALAKRLIWMCTVDVPCDLAQKGVNREKFTLQKPFKGTQLLAVIEELLLSLNAHPTPIH